MSATAAPASTVTTTTAPATAKTGAAPAAESAKMAAPKAGEAAPSAPPQAAPEAAPKAEPAPEPKKAEPDLRKQFAALAREDARVQQERAEMKRERAELDGLREIKALMEGKGDKYALLDKLGIDVNVWARRKLNGGKETTDERLERLETERKEEQRQRQEQEKHAATQRQAAAETKARADLVADLDKFVQDAGDRFELIKARGAADVVYETMDAHYRETGRILEYEEACSLVEQHLEAEALKLTGLSKIKSKLAAQAATAAEASAEAAPKQVPASGTKAKQPQPVTNNLASTAPDRVPANLTMEERKRRFRERLRSE